MKMFEVGKCYVCEYLKEEKWYTVQAKILKRTKKTVTIELIDALHKQQEGNHKVYIDVFGNERAGSYGFVLNA